MTGDVKARRVEVLVGEGVEAEEIVRAMGRVGYAAEG